MKRLLSNRGLLSLFAISLFAPDLLATDTNAPPRHHRHGRYAELTKAEKQVPFKEVIEGTTGYRVLDFDTNNPAHVDLQGKLRKAAAIAGEKVTEQGIIANRPNDASTQLEPFIRNALRDAGLKARVPVNSSGEPRTTGYPDIEIDGPVPCYLEVTTYSAATENALHRSINYSPSAKSGITRDALHFVLAFQMEKTSRNGRTRCVPIRWKLITLENLTVDLKYEFTQSNRALYCEDPARSLVSEGNVK